MAETELKLDLPDAETIDRLVAACAEELEPEHQENSYFDDVHGSWRTRGLGVRLRRVRAGARSHLELTVKSAGVRVGSFVERGEWQRRIDEVEGKLLSEDPSVLTAAALDLLPRALRFVPPAPLELVGTMRNARRRARPFAELPWVLELDATTYPDGSVHFEAELEVEDASRVPEAESRLRALFDAVGVVWAPSSVSKRERLQRILDAQS